MGAEIAHNVDALNIDVRTVVDDIGDVDAAVDFVAIEAWANLCEGVTLLRCGDGERFGGILDPLTVIDTAGPGHHGATQRTRVERGQGGFDVDVAKSILRTFVDRVSDEKAAAIAIEVGGGRQNPDIGIAVLEIELAQQLAIQIETVRVVDVGALEEAQDIGLRRADDIAQLRIAERGISYEIDSAHLGARSLSNLEHHVNSVIGLVYDLGVDLRRVHALAAIHIKNALYVGLHAGPGIDGARLELDLGRQCVVVDLLVAFECDLGDDRVFDHDDDDRSSLAPDANVLK